MKNYAKITESGYLQYAPRNFNNISNWIEDTEAVLAEGYLPVEIPTAPEGMVLKRYIEKDGVITAEFEKHYIAQRRAAYPEIGEQLDMIYWDKQYSTNIWEETIRAIKEKYPKPTSSE